MLNAQAKWEITRHDGRDTANACVLLFIGKTVSFFTNIAMSYFCHGSECWSWRVLVLAGKAEAAHGLLMVFVQGSGPELGKNLPGGWVTRG